MTAGNFCLIPDLVLHAGTSLASRTRTRKGNKKEQKKGQKKGTVNDPNSPQQGRDEFYDICEPIRSGGCTKKKGRTINFTIVPPFSWPVQGKCPEVAAEHLEPSSWNAASGQSSHQHQQITPHACTFFSCSHATLLTPSSHPIFVGAPSFNQTDGYFEERCPISDQLVFRAGPGVQQMQDY
ncbi:hypothetical protein C8R44DRAFT_752274 [Mycena epipterygia]|nr:hypothetical protein C8R44DRAFT_752274 [Mycena epipterygia]